MLEDLEIGEAQAVEPERLARKTEELPAAIAKAWDETPVGEAKRLPIAVPEGKGAKIGSTILRLLRRRAAAQGLMAFKASATPTTATGLLLYWQKRPGRGKKPDPAIQVKPDEDVAEHVEFLKETLKRGRRISPATDELRDE
jgi:hypothetical protein